MRKLGLVSMVVALAACGGAEEPKQTAPAPALETGNEAPIGPTEAEGAPAGEGSAADGGDDTSTAPEPEPEPQPTGPAKLTADILVDNEEAPGKVRLLSASGEEVGAGTAGKTFTVDAGDYIIEATIEDASVLVDTPTKQGEMFTLGPGDERTEAVEFGRSRVRLIVKRGARRIRRGRIELRRQGAEVTVLETKIKDEHIPISPGRYEATVHFGQNEVDVSGLVFQGGARQNIPINVN